MDSGLRPSASPGMTKSDSAARWIPGSGFAGPGMTTPLRICPASGLKPHRGPVQVIGVRAFDLDGGDFADAQRPAARHVHSPVDLRRVAFAAALGDGWPHLVDDDLPPLPDLAFQALHRDGVL